MLSDHLPLIINIGSDIAIGSLVFLLWIFFRRNSNSLAKRLEAIEKETRAIEQKQKNNTICLADIHGIVSSINEERLSLK